MFLLTSAGSEDSVALYDAEARHPWTYGELASEVEAFGKAYAGERKALIFLFCRNSAECVLAYLAAVNSGNAIALLDEKLPSDFKKKLIDQYRPDFLASHTAIDECREDYCNTPAGQFSLSLTRRRESSEGGIHPDVALMLSTSGSTGTAKFVRLSRANIESNAKAIAAALGINSAEKAISSLPLHYSYGLSVINSHLALGASVVLTDDGLMSPRFWDGVRNEGCTSFAGVPYSYQILRRLGLEKLNAPSLKTLTQAGGKLDRVSVSHFHEQMARRGGKFFVMYGQTEACARIAILPHESLPEKLGSAGRAIPGGRLSIETDDGIPAETGGSGEIVYRGPNVMMGYANGREDLAHGDNMQGCLRTGDAGYLDTDGCLFVTGRLKRDAKVFGLRLNLDEVEQMLRERGPAAVVSRDEKLLIYCEYGDEQLFAEYRRELAARLKVHFGALEFRRIPELPLHANGKIDYQILQAHP